MLVTSIFSFYRNVFKRLLSQGRKKSGLSVKGLSNVPVNLWLPMPFVQVHNCVVWSLLHDEKVDSPKLKAFAFDNFYLVFL